MPPFASRVSSGSLFAVLCSLTSNERVQQIRYWFAPGTISTNLHCCKIQCWLNHFQGSIQPPGTRMRATTPRDHLARQPFECAHVADDGLSCFALGLLLRREVAIIISNLATETVNITVFNIFITFIIVIITFLKIIINNILILNPSQVDKNFHLIFHIFNLLEASWTSTSAPKRISSLGTALKKLTWTTVGGLWASLVFFLKEAKPLERSEKLLEEWRGARFRTL